MAVLATLGGVVAVAGVLVLVGVNTAATAVTIRFFRIRLSTQWATVLYAVLLLPLLYALTTLVVLGVTGIGAGTSIDRQTLLLFVWGLPLAFGAAIEVFWMPPPESFDTPHQTEQRQ